MAMLGDKISDHFEVPTKAEVDVMSLAELKQIGKSLNAQRDVLVQLYRKATDYLQARIAGQIFIEKNARRQADPDTYDALHQGIGTTKP